MSGSVELIFNLDLTIRLIHNVQNVHFLHIHYESYLSASPIIGSMLPIIATTSETI